MSILLILTAVGQVNAALALLKADGVKCDLSVVDIHGRNIVWCVLLSFTDYLSLTVLHKPYHSHNFTAFESLVHLLSPTHTFHCYPLTLCRSLLYSFSFLSLPLTIIYTLSLSLSLFRSTLTAFRCIPFTPLH